MKRQGTRLSDKTLRCSRDSCRFVSLRKRNCWQSALDEMKEQCRSRSEDSLARLAFRFTNCHLEQSGLRVYSCAPKASTIECTKRLARDASAFAAFTQFRVHVWTICFSLEQKEMEDYMFWVTRTLLTDPRGPSSSRSASSTAWTASAHSKRGFTTRPWRQSPW